uniref:HTH CENPB-type domain-containing protein n=1 Tax=Daphnia galeata TaxID=27404 RepID=A0A8J2RLG1_9CRUS|nr:unnamed protein product [Daphnia galeata]
MTARKTQNPHELSKDEKFSETQKYQHIGILDALLNQIEKGNFKEGKQFFFSLTKKILHIVSMMFVIGQTTGRTFKLSPKMKGLGCQNSKNTSKRSPIQPAFVTDILLSSTRFIDYENCLWDLRDHDSYNIYGSTLRKTLSTLTLENKFKAIQLIKEKKSERCVAEIMGDSRSQISRISISKEKIENFYQDKVFQPVAKVMANRSVNADLDKAVHNWFREMRNPLGNRKPLSLSRAIIQARALHEAKKIGLTEFKASDGWFRNWRRRNGIGPSLRLFVEAGDVNIEEVEKLIQIIREKLKKFKAENIFNMDETGLLYRALPTRSYISLEEGSRKNIRGTKVLQAKDPVTLVLCVNSTGTCKVAPLIVGTSKNPHCFRDAPSPIPYINQRNAWVDREVYKGWWLNIFLTAVRKFTKEPVALLMDNCSGHDPTLTDPTGQVEIIFLPPNCTSVYQPLDQWIISTLKTIYKRKCSVTYDNFDELQAQASEAKKGTKGLRFGCSANVLEARLVKKSWDSITVETI